MTTTNFDTNVLHPWIDSKKIASYVNGNYMVFIYEDGTKIRENETGKFIPEFPESIDLKITNQCNLANLCTYCHEKSNLNGLHSSLDRILSFVSGLPRGVEIAIGGGNPLSYHKLQTLISELDDRGLICNITINQEHVGKYEVPDKVKGIGVSFRRRKLLPEIKEMNHVIHHLILGIHTWDDFLWLCQTYYAPKILWLGFKFVGNGTDFINSLEAYTRFTNNLDSVKTNLHRSLNETNLIAFDNLAIEQLSPHDIFEKGDYMGDDGKFSFYYDAVKNEYAKGSSYNDRIDAKDLNACEIFQKLK